MDRAEIERKVEEVLHRDEDKFIKALELYYSNFKNNGTGMTFGSAAHLAKANPAYLVNYMSYCPAYIGMPETREEAQTFLQNLREYQQSKAA